MIGSVARLKAIRVDNGAAALLLCSAASAFVGACAFAIGMASSSTPGSAAVGLAVSRILLATFAGTIVLIPASLVLALPATWLGRRFRLESGLYYFGTGTIAGAGCGLAIMGLPKADEFLFEQIVRLTGPVFGGSWGLLWWTIYRRWRREPR
jgi:hypothetical protein